MKKGTYAKNICFWLTEFVDIQPSTETYTQLLRKR